MYSPSVYPTHHPGAFEIMVFMGMDALKLLLFRKESGGGKVKEG